MPSKLITPVILSGGSGSRLWPLSRAGYPKQFLPLAGQNTMLQETAQRVADSRFSDPLIICNEEHRFIVAEQLRDQARQHGDIILEPLGRNTAPAVAVAALRLIETDENALMLVMPSDHVIKNHQAFLDAVESAAAAAQEGALVTFGITPNQPETGYGYIKRAEQWGAHGGVHGVERFVEKPDAATAQSYLDAGSYLWNSGIFLFTARAYLNELEGAHSEMIKACRQALAEGERLLGEAEAAGVAARLIAMPNSSDDILVSVDYLRPAPDGTNLAP